MKFIANQKETLLEMQSTFKARIESNKQQCTCECEDRSAEGKADQYALNQSIEAQIKKDKEQLQFTERSLNLIEAGRYGICFTCQEDIPRDRLEANPLAVRCMDCTS